MLKSSNVTASNKVSQAHAAVARAAVDQAAVTTAHYAKLGAQQAALAGKCAAAYVGGFVATFFAKK